jgi:hypothetical protein
MADNEKHIASMETDVKKVETDIRGADPTQATGTIHVRITFAVSTERNAWMILTENGEVKLSFGGTGTTNGELAKYVTRAIEIYQAVTGDTDTEFERPTEPKPITSDPRHEQS